MASTIPGTDTDCCSTCTNPVDVNVPGPAGPSGANGTDGTDGLNAFAVIVGGATLVPAYGATATIELSAPPGSLWVGQQQPIFIQSYGTYEVVAIPDNTHVTVLNLGYATNVNGNGAIAFAAGTRVSPGGREGSGGSAPVGALLSANNLNDVASAPASRANLGLGTSATQPASDFFQVVNNLSEGVAATKRTNLGLGSAAVLAAGVANANLPPVDTTFTPGDAVFATASGIQTKSAANARTALGLSGGVGAYILAQNQQATTVSGGSCNNSVPVVVPINTLVQDGGGIVTLASNALLLPTGVYRVRASVPAYKVDAFQAWLYNIDDAVVAFYGSNASADAATINNAISLVNGRLTVTGGPKHYRLMAQCVSTRATDGFGKAGSFGGTEVYASWELEKES